MKLYPYKTLIMKFCLVALLLVVCRRTRSPQIAKKSNDIENSKNAQNTELAVQGDKINSGDNDELILKQLSVSERIKIVSSQLKVFEDTFKKNEQANTGLKKALEQVKSLSSWQELQKACKDEKTSTALLIATLKSFISKFNKYLDTTSTEAITKIIRAASPKPDKRMLITWNIALILNKKEASETYGSAILEGINYALLVPENNVPSEESYEIFKNVITALSEEIIGSKKTIAN